MAITNKLITFNKLTSFETQLAAGNILNTSIVFIKDAKKIWTKGTYFDCSGGSNNIAIYETTDDVYNGVLTYSASINQIFINSNIYTIVIKQRTGVGKYNIFVFNKCSEKDPGVDYFSCLYVNDSEHILYKLSYLESSNTITLTKQDLALKSDIGYTTEFTVADIEAVYGRGITKSINVQGLISAIEANRPIIIPTAITDTSNVGGNAVTMAAMVNDGFIYLNVIVPYLDGIHKEYFIQINVTTAQLVKSGSDGSITLKELVAKTDLKTINGESILGNGDIVVSGGSSSGSAAYSEVNHGTNDTTFTLTPNTFHIWDEVSSLTLTLGSETSGVANEYLFQFTSGATATILSLPDDIKWVGGETPTIEANKIHQISVLKGLGSLLSWDNVVSIFPITLATGTTTDAGKQVYIELEKLGVSGELEVGLLYVYSNGYTFEITTFTFDSTRNAYRLTFGMSSIFLDSSGYCYTVIID